MKILYAIGLVFFSVALFGLSACGKNSNSSAEKSMPIDLGDGLFYEALDKNNYSIKSFTTDGEIRYVSFVNRKTNVNCTAMFFEDTIIIKSNEDSIISEEVKRLIRNQ